jgi:hypothetical protein
MNREAGRPLNNLDANAIVPRTATTNPAEFSISNMHTITYPDVASVDTLTRASISMTDNHTSNMNPNILNKNMQTFESDGSSEGSSVLTSFQGPIRIIDRRNVPLNLSASGSEFKNDASNIIVETTGR